MGVNGTINSKLLVHSPKYMEHSRTTQKQCTKQQDKEEKQLAYSSYGAQLKHMQMCWWCYIYSRLLNTQLFQLQPQTESSNVSNTCMPGLRATLLRSCVILRGHILQSTGTTYHSFKLRPPPNRKGLINNLFIFEERSKFETTLTNVCCVNSNVYDLHNIH